MKRFKFKTPAVVTAGINEKMQQDFRFYQFCTDSLYLHFSGNFGDICAEDAELSEYGIKHRERVFSAYVDDHDIKIWIITDAGHDVTTILFPSEY